MVFGTGGGTDTSLQLATISNFVSPQWFAQIDGSDTQFVLNIDQTPGRMPTVGDRVLVSRQGSQMYEVALVKSNAPATGMVPIGSLIAYVGAIGSVPPGWLITAGANISEADYPTLCAVLIAAGAPVSGVAPTRTVTLPNTQDKFISGVGLASVRTLYGSGGSDLYALPNHTHDIVPDNLAQTTAANTPTTGGANRVVSLSGTVLGNHAHGGATGNPVTIPNYTAVPKWFGALYIIRAL